jgi:hypothetical protein
MEVSSDCPVEDVTLLTPYSKELPSQQKQRIETLVYKAAVGLTRNQRVLEQYLGCLSSSCTADVAGEQGPVDKAWLNNRMSDRTNAHAPESNPSAQAGCKSRQVEQRMRLNIA